MILLKSFPFLQILVLSLHVIFNIFLKNHISAAAFFILDFFNSLLVAQRANPYA